MNKQKQTLTLLLCLLPFFVGAQHLADLYKSGSIVLTADPSYGNKNDWNKLLPEYAQKDFGHETGVSKNIVVAPDGSVFMSHRTRHSISKFDKYGNFLFEFGKKGGKKASDFIYMPSVEGILDNKYLYTTAVDGRMHFFDLNGKWVKTLTLKYMPLKTIPLKNGTIAILGHVPWKNSQSKSIISLLDFRTGKEKAIYSEIESYAQQGIVTIEPYTVKDQNGKEQKCGPAISLGNPVSDGTYSKPFLAFSSDGKLVLGNPQTAEIRTIDYTGKVIRSFKANITSQAISSTDRNNYYEKAKGNFSQIKSMIGGDSHGKEYVEYYQREYLKQIEKFKEPAYYPPHLPYFSQLMVDSDNNILLFRYTKEEGSNKFDVFSFDTQGKKIATSSFLSKEYELQINPNIFKFHGGNIYSFAKLKSVKSGNPMRLVKFRLEKEK